MKKIFCLFFLLISFTAFAQRERHNFYVTGKDKGFHFSSLTVKAQALLHDIFSKPFHFITVSSDEEAVAKIKKY